MRPTLPMLVAALMGTALPSWSATIHVPGMEPTIQAGVDAAAPGDTVLVAPGTYTGPGNRDIGFAGRSIVLRSSGGSAATIVDCQTLSRAFHFDGGETALTVLEGFTIRNGREALGYGGGVLVQGSSPTIGDCALTGCRANTGGGMFFAASSSRVTGCDISTNVADNWGGGMYAESCPDLVLTDCSLAGNTAAFGAGLYVIQSSTVTISGSSFSSNAPANSGGGIYCDGSALTLTGCTFTGNTGKKGAGVYCLDGASAVLDGCTFSTNTASFLGGGIHAEETSLSLVRCTFTGNRTTGGPNLELGGGGLHLHTTSATAPFSMVGCTFTGNSTLGVNAEGGGLRLNHGPDPPSVAIISGCVFTGNHAQREGGGAHVGSFGCVIADCTFTDNSADVEGGGLYFAGPDSLLRCTFSRNHSNGFGGGLWAGGNPLTVSGCTFTDNTATDQGGGIYRQMVLDPFTMIDSRLSGNFAPLGGGLLLATGWPSNPGSASISGCIFEENSAVAGGGASIVPRPGYIPGAVSLTRCTFARNSGSFGGGIDLKVPVTVSNTIVAFGMGGEAIRCDGAGEAVLSCTDIYGNAGGDWVGCIADQLGINGCFAADPLFCNAAGGNYTLAEGSACAPANAPAGCGLIGALGVGCVVPIGVMEAAPPASWPAVRVVPNPVAADAVVELVGARSPAVLSLYDAAGRLVARRDLGAPIGGSHRLRWTDLAGPRGLPAGVYFLELSPGRGGAERIVVVR